MKNYKFSSTILIALIVCSSIALAQADAASVPAELPVPTILPTSSLYGVKIAMENFKMAFLTKTGKAEYGMKRAMYRVAEAEKLRDKNNDAAADLAEEQAKTLIDNYKTYIDGIKDEARAKKLQDRSGKNIDVITALIAAREASGKTNGLKGLKNALDQFHTKAAEKFAEKFDERVVKENAKEVAKENKQKARSARAQTNTATQNNAAQNSVVRNADTTLTTTLTTSQECSQNEDCAPANCCHALSSATCVSIPNKPSCDGIACSQEVRDPTISGCACENQKCVTIPARNEGRGY